MKNLKKLLAILLTALVMLSITTVLAGAVNGERVSHADNSITKAAESQDDFKISKIFRLGDGDSLSKEEILKYVDIEGADKYFVSSFYLFSDVYDEDYNLLGFTSDNGNGIDLITVDAMKSVYDAEYDCYNYDYIGCQYFLLVVNTDGEDMGKVKSISLDDFTFNYKSENAWIYPYVETENDTGAYWIEYYMIEDFSDIPYVFTDGSVDTFATGKSNVTCYVIDAEGNVFKDDCTVRVRLSFLQWIIKYLCFGWLWGF